MNTKTCRHWIRDLPGVGSGLTGDDPFGTPPSDGTAAKCEALAAEAASLVARLEAARAELRRQERLAAQRARRSYSEDEIKAAKEAK